MRGVGPTRVLVAVLAVVLAGCGGGGGDDGSTSAESTSTTSANAPEAAVEEVTTSTTGVATTLPGSAPASAAPTDGGGPPADAAVPAPIPAGTYRYRQSGAATVGTERYDSPPEGTLVADAPSGDGRQVIHRYIDPDGQPADSTLRFGADGIFLLDTLVRMGATEIRCSFDPPLAAPPWPPTVGASATGHGDCGPTFSTDVTSEITEARVVELDGRSYDAVVVRSVITTTGQLESTTDQVDWFVPELRMSVHTEQDMTGRYGTFTFESHGTSDLLSAVPT